jgi:hypothetical protein
VLHSAAIAQSVRITNNAQEEKAATHDANGRSLKSIREGEAAKEAAEKKKKRKTEEKEEGGGSLERENAALRAALAELTGKVASLETEIREEVAEEFEDMIAEIHADYAEQREAALGARAVPTPHKSVRKLQSERANDYVDELLDKLRECEEEMGRMRCVGRAERNAPSAKTKTGR